MANSTDDTVLHIGCNVNISTVFGVICLHIPHVECEGVPDASSCGVIPGGEGVVGNNVNGSPV